MRLKLRVRSIPTDARKYWGFPTLNYRSRVKSDLLARFGAGAAVAALAAAGFAACGTPSPDLFVVERDGTVPGAKLRLLVSDQTTRCNRAAAKQLTSAQILEARDLRDDLIALQQSKDPIPDAGPAQIFSFVVQTEAGRLRYPDTQQRPDVLPRLTRFVRRVAIDTCGLKR